MLSVAGTNYHVLSRVCDSGVDHTQRTNAFAHHLVVERAELAAASGGPAWMLMQAGVMVESWDGKVGAIGRGAKLPAGDAGARICERWKELTGDAGWGGVLADAFVKSPQKPVCVVFGPGQEILPLLAETIALLPAAARWNVTFNTYFTSMPTSATCLWRCCLAGTPAATSGLRYAAGGIVIDLTDPARLGKPADGLYVTYARTGVAPGAATAPAAAVAAKKAAAKGKATVPQKAAPAKKAAVEDDDEDSIDLRPVEYAGIGVGGEAGMVTALEEEEQRELERGAGDGEVRGKPKRPLLRRRITAEAPAEVQYIDVESEAGKAAARRRKQVLMLFGGAVGLIGLAVVLVVVSMVTNAPPELPPVIKPKVTPTTVANVAPLPPAAQMAVPVVHAPVIQTPAPLPDQNNTVVVPAPKRDVPKETVTGPVEVIPEHPAVVMVTEPLEFPEVGQGMRESVGQKLSTAGVDRRTGIEKNEIRFPQSKGDYPGSMSFGTGTLVASVRPTKPTTAVMQWKDAAAGADADPVELMSLTLSKSHTELELTWLTGPLVKDVENVRRAYWVLRNSRIEVEWKNRTQEIAFAAGDPAPVGMEAGGVLTLPTALPKETVVAAPTEQQLGHGWGATTFTETASKDGVLLTGENKAVVVKFQQKSAVPASAPWFIVRFSPAMDRVESTFGARMEASQADLKQAQDDEQAADDMLARMAKDAGGKLPASDQVKLVQTKRADAATLVEAYKSTVDGYNALEQFDIELTLPNGMHLTTVRFRRAAK